MVSIFADTIYQETDSISVTAGLDVRDWPNFDFGTVSVDTQLGGFTYAETLILQIEFTSTFDVENTNTTGSGRYWRLSSSPTFEYDGSLDLFGGVGNEILFQDEINTGATETYASPSGSKTINLDTYLDVPADFTANTVWQDQVNDTESPSAQTITAQFTANIIGRQP